MDQINPKISVIIIAYNVEEYIDQCLESVMIQTLQDIEIIVTEDCSTDTTLSHIEAAAERDKRIRIIRHEMNRGKLQSRKDAILASCGEYIMFVDSDDWVEPDACERLYAKMRETGVDILHFGTFVENCKNLPKKRIAAVERDVAPYMGSVREHPFVTCFVERRFENYLWSKIYRGDLVRDAHSEMEDGYYIFIEDIYQNFCILLKSKSYLGTEDRLYHYCYGRGGLGVTALSLEDFRDRCNCADLYRAIRRYLARMEESENSDESAALLLDSARVAVKNLQIRFEKILLGYFLNILRKEDQAAAFITMESAWQMDGSAFVGMLAEAGWEQRKQIAKALAGADYLRFQKRPIKTIAVACCRIHNEDAERVEDTLCRLLLNLKDETGAPLFKIVLVTEESTSGDYPLPPQVIREQIPPHEGRAGKDYPARAAAWARIVREHNIDAVLFSDWMIPQAFWDMLAIKRTEQNPAFVVYIHNWCASMYEERSDAVEERAEVFHLADGIVTVSALDQLYWSRINPNTYYIPNPCFVKASQASRVSFGKQILSLARNGSNKQALEIIRIMREAVACDPEVICRIVADQDQSLRAELEENIREQGLSDNIILEDFCSDATPDYVHCSLFLMTSRCEGFPMTLFESAAFGVPTVMYELPWLSYCTMAEGWIDVPQLDAKAAAEAIVRIVNDPLEWQRRSDALYESALKYEKMDIYANWFEMLSNLEQGIEPKAPTLNEPTRLLLDQIDCFHGIAVRGLVGESKQKQKRNDNLQKQNDNLQKQNDNLQKQNGNLQKQNGNLQKQNDNLQKQNDNLQEHIKKLEKKQQKEAEKVEREKRKNELLRSSYSFRIGRSITWLPRKLRDGVRCLKEHGICFTIHRFFEHLTRK